MSEAGKGPSSLLLWSWVNSAAEPPWYLLVLALSLTKQAAGGRIWKAVKGWNEIPITWGWSEWELNWELRRVKSQIQLQGQKLKTGSSGSAWHALCCFHWFISCCKGLVSYPQFCHKLTRTLVSCNLEAKQSTSIRRMSQMRNHDRTTLPVLFTGKNSFLLTKLLLKTSSRCKLSVCIKKWEKAMTPL